MKLSDDLGSCRKQCGTFRENNCEAAMIKLLAEFFRGIHYIVGISLPPPSIDDRKFVLAWLCGIAAFVAFCVIIFVYLIPALYFSH